MTLRISAFLTATLLAWPLLAEETPQAQRAAGCTESVTVFQDVSIVGRKDRAASNITERHEEMAREGWRFIGLEAYTENGDLEGFFLSYTRDRACP